MPKAKKRRTPLSKLRGAARKARLKKLGKSRKTISTKVRNPRKSPKRVAAAKKAAATRKRKAAARSAAARKAARTRKRGTAMRRNARKTVRRRRKTTARRPARRRRTTRRYRRNPRTLTKARARRMQRAGAKKRATKKYRRYRSSKQRQYLRAPVRNRKHKGRVVKSLGKARRSILWNKAYGSAQSRKFMKRYGMRSNIGGGAMDAVKRAIPVAAAMYGSKMLSAGLVPRLPVIGGGTHAAPAAAGLLLLGASFATKKVAFLGKYRQEILMGAGLNFLDVVLTNYAPDSVKSMLGLPVAAVAASPTAAGEYFDMGEYLEIGGYEAEMGEYIDIGAEEDLGAYAELGEGNIGTGIGTQSASMIRSVPRRMMSAPVPSRSFVKEVPGVGSGFDALDSLYTGVFAGGLK